MKDSTRDERMVLTGQSVYVGASSLSNYKSTLYKSDNQGRTWTKVKNFPAFMRSIHIGRKNPATIFVGTQVDPRTSNDLDGIWRSLDSGKSWALYPYDGNNRGLIPWDIDEGIDGTLYVGTEIYDHPQPYYPPFFRSTDKGETWENISNGLPWHVTSIQTHPYKNIVYALTEGDLLFTFNHNNKRWEVVGSSSNLGFNLLLDTLNPNRLFMGDVVYKARSGGAYMSTDSGRTFSPIGLEDIEDITVTGFALNKTSTKLYAAGYKSGIWSVRIPDK